MEYKHDFAWGDTRGIREIMIKHAPFLNLMQYDYGTYGYPPHMGRPELVEALKVLVWKITGYRYKFLLVTNGALNAISAYLYAVKTGDTVGMFTNSTYFGRYPGVANNAGLIHITEESHESPAENDIWVIDSPSNPAGKLSLKGRSKNCIWDAAYYSPTYCGIPRNGHLFASPVMPMHEAMAGSLNKLTGINGIRIGWLATDDEQIYNKALEYITSDLCGVSQLSQVMAHKLITTVDMDAFFAESKKMLDDNKTELTRLNYLFGSQPIPQHGMFVLFEVDQSLRDLLERASVNVMDGKNCGDHNRNSIRFNLGNSTKSTKEMVDAILKADGK